MRNMTDAQVYRSTENEVLKWEFTLNCTQGGVFGECDVSDTTNYKKESSVVEQELEKLIYINDI